MTQTMQRPPQTEQAQPVYEITEADKKRQQKIADAWKAYQGELEPPLKIMPDGTDPNVMTNRCLPVVDGGINFLFGKELEISIEENGPQEAQDFLNEVWGRKEARLPLLQKLAMNGAIAGQAFLRIVPGDDGSFRLVVIDPSTVFMQTAPQDCETVTLFCIQYSQMEKFQDRPREVFYREEITRIDSDDGTQEYYEDADASTTWQIQHWTQVAASAGMQPKNTGWTPAGEPIMWPYPFPPIFHCQNLPKANDPWGIPDITPDLIGVNKEVNLAQSCIQLMLLLYGQPILYSTGTGESRIRIDPGYILGLPTTESKIVAVALTTDIANGLKFIADLRSDMDEQSSYPSVASGRIETMPRGNLSGIAIELLFMPILKKTEKKQCLYGELIIDVSQALLTLNHMDGSMDITLAWQNPLPHDDLPAVQAAIAKKEINISNTTLMRELGYDPDEEMELSKQEDADAALNQMQQQIQQLPLADPGTKALPGQQYPMPPKQGGQQP